VKRALRLFAAFNLSSSSTPTTGEAYATHETIVSRNAEVDGVKLRYLAAGHDPTVILLHGYTRTSRMWKPIISLLCEIYRDEVSVKSPTGSKNECGSFSFEQRHRFQEEAVDALTPCGGRDGRKSLPGIAAQLSCRRP